MFLYLFSNLAPDRCWPLIHLWCSYILPLFSRYFLSILLFAFLFASQSGAAFTTYIKYIFLYPLNLELTFSIHRHNLIAWLNIFRLLYIFIYRENHFMSQKVLKKKIACYDIFQYKKYNRSMLFILYFFIETLKWFSLVYFSELIEFFWWHSPNRIDHLGFS